MRDLEPAPSDYLSPEWHVDERVHNWRNYISDELREIWDTFTPKQKEAIARNADEIAGKEDWD